MGSLRKNQYKFINYIKNLNQNAFLKKNYQKRFKLIIKPF